MVACISDCDEIIHINKDTITQDVYKYKDKMIHKMIFVIKRISTT
jgi:hypothetical protein